MDFNLIQALDSTTTVSGAPGLFYPLDKAKLERLWHRVLEMSDVLYDLTEAMLRIEALEEATGDLADIRANIEGLQTEALSLRGDLDESNARFEDFSSDTGLRFSAFESNFEDVEGRLDTMADNQLDYVRNIAYATDTGVLHFFNGVGADVFTIGGATYETVAADDGDSDSDGDTP